MAVPRICHAPNGCRRSCLPVPSAGRPPAGRPVRCKQLTGQSQRDLELYARIEAAVEHAARHDQDLATLAARSGYSDQSHLGRELKRVTGLPARQLRERMMQEEAFWLYRLLDAMAAET